MRILMAIALVFYLPLANAAAGIDAQKSVNDFYNFYLAQYEQHSPPEVINMAKTRQWVSATLRKRMNAIYNLPEQEFLGAVILPIPRITTRPGSHG